MKKEIKVSGMRCLSCEMLVSEALEELEGVRHAKAFHQRRVIEVDYDPSKIDDDAIKQAMKVKGYSVEA